MTLLGLHLANPKIRRRQNWLVEGEDEDQLEEKQKEETGEVTGVTPNQIF